MDSSTLEKLAVFICGDAEDAPIYRSSSRITDFFQRCGLPFTHDGSTRWRWTLGRLQECSSSQIQTVIKRLANPREYNGDKDKTQAALRGLNKLLYVEGKRVRLDRLEPKIEAIEPDFNVEEAREEFKLEPLPPPDWSALQLENGLDELLSTRWTEAQVCVDSGAHLAALILMGSLLEGLLLGAFQRNPRQANTVTRTPKNRSTGKPKPFADWTLHEMIEVAHELDWLGLDVKKFSHALREFRNLVHPHQQLSTGARPDQDTCRISWLVVQAAVNDIARILR